jgi:putative DNA modification/repair radical SAM protein
MNTVEKLQILGEAAKYDVCASTSCGEGAVKNSRKGESRIGSLTGPGICHSFGPDGRCISLFKVLMSNRCQGDCRYCTNNCETERRRASFEPDELRETFLTLYHRNLVEGLFLSSGVAKSADETEQGLIEIAEKLRSKDNFHGYIHLKIMPGTSRSLVRHAAEVADRVSLNLEAPNRLRFQEITSTKDFGIDLLRRMRWAQKAVDKQKSGQTTQFVVGACDESDSEILSTVSDVYDKLELKRSYFSAFIPVSGTRLEGHEKTPLMREHRLYQCDFLMRKYHFPLEELVFGEGGCLELGKDPKMAMALADPGRFPVEINEADYGELLRVPGLGPNCAYRITQARDAGHRFRDLSELRNLGVVLKRAKPFISVNGVRQTSLASFQNAISA